MRSIPVNFLLPIEGNPVQGDGSLTPTRCLRVLSLMRLVNPSADNARRWIAALSQLPDHAAAELAADPDVFATDRIFAIRINDEITVDVMPSIAGCSWDEMVPHITTTEVDGISIRLIDLQGLLKTKQGPRPKDQMDAAVLAAALQALPK